MCRLFFAAVILFTMTSCALHKEYYDNGNLKAKGRIANGLKNGMWKSFDEQGHVSEIGKYLDGKENGRWQIFHENGQIRQTGKFNHGKQTGDWKFFHANGNRQGTGTLIEGRKTGIWTWYFETGARQTERRWSAGKLVEIVGTYDGQGNQLDKGTYSKGAGTMNIYDQNGSLTEISVFEEGEFKEVIELPLQKDR